MFKYKVLKETSRDGLTFAETVLETDNEKEVLEKYPQLSDYIPKIKQELQKSIEERKKKTESEAPDFPESMKLTWIYSPIISRLVFDVPTADEALVLEVGYSPIDIVLSEIEKRLNRKIELLPDQKIYVLKQKNRLILQQYCPSRKNKRSTLNTKNTPEIATLLQILQEMWNETAQKFHLNYRHWGGARSSKVIIGSYEEEKNRERNEILNSSIRSKIYQKVKEKLKEIDIDEFLNK